MRFLFAVLAGCYMGLIWWGSDQRPREIPIDLPGPSLNLLHVPANCVLAALLLRACVPWAGLFAPRSWPGGFRGPGAIVMGIVLLHGLADEAHQFWVPGRCCSVLDIGMDLAGAAVVLVSPWPSGIGRPSGWRPFLLVLAAGIAIGVLGWMGRPFPDRLLEDLLSHLFAPAQG